MSRFYFHILNGRHIADDAGLELATVDAARTEAVRFAGAVLSEENPTGIWRGKPWEMQVSDVPSLDGGKTFFTLTFSAKNAA